MARRRRLEPVTAQPDDDVPDWLWGFPMNRWAAERKAAGEPVDLGVFCRERDAWREQRDAWLRERGLVLYGMRGLTSEEFSRIKREEPHRVLLRP
jgi:hypothetical protein